MQDRYSGEVGDYMELATRRELAPGQQLGLGGGSTRIKTTTAAFAMLDT